jgi:hypothetical protein
LLIPPVWNGGQAEMRFGAMRHTASAGPQAVRGEPIVKIYSAESRAPDRQIPHSRSPGRDDPIIRHRPAADNARGSAAAEPPERHGRRRIRNRRTRNKSRNCGRVEIDSTRPARCGSPDGDTGPLSPTHESPQTVSKCGAHGLNRPPIRGYR